MPAWNRKACLVLHSSRLRLLCPYFTMIPLQILNSLLPAINLEIRLWNDTLPSSHLVLRTFIISRYLAKAIILLHIFLTRALSKVSSWCLCLKILIMLLLITWKTRSFWRSRSNCSLLIMTLRTLWSVVKPRVYGDPIDLFLSSSNSFFFLFLCIIFRRCHYFKYSSVFSRSVSSTMLLILLSVLSLNCFAVLFLWVSILLASSAYYFYPITPCLFVTISISSEPTDLVYSSSETSLIRLRSMAGKLSMLRLTFF